MNLIPDYSILLQIIIFLLVWKGLSSLAFAPTTAVLDERARRTVAAEDLAKQLVSAAGEDRATYDRAVHERRAQMSAESASARASAQEEATRLLTQARAEANAAFATQRDAVAEQIVSARQRLAAETQEVANLMLERVQGASS